jgi:hypothetical protein
LTVPVSVSLLKLVQIAHTESLWPEVFRGMIEKYENELNEKPDERTPLAPISDWLEENGESELAGACKWLIKRPEVALDKTYNRHHNFAERYSYWRTIGMTPPAFGQRQGEENTGLAGLLAAIADRIQELKALTE